MRAGAGRPTAFSGGIEERGPVCTAVTAACMAAAASRLGCWATGQSLPCGALGAPRPGPGLDLSSHRLHSSDRSVAEPLGVLQAPPPHFPHTMKFIWGAAVLLAAPRAVSHETCWVLALESPEGDSALRLIRTNTNSELAQPAREMLR